MPNFPNARTFIYTRIALMNSRPFIFFFAFVLCVSCTKLAQDNAHNSQKVDGTERLVAQEDTLTVGICLWDKVGLRAAPGMNKNIDYITTIYLGERIYLLGESKEVEKENRTYIKVRLSDGSEGWVYKYLFACDARLAAISTTTNLYRRPDEMMLKSQRFETGEILAITDEKDGWYQVAGKDKRKIGWVNQTANITEDYDDIMVAVLYQKALLERNMKDKVEMLNVIVEKAGNLNSDFLKLVEENLAKTTSQLNTSSTVSKLKIEGPKAEMRLTPHLDERNIVLELAEGTICKVLAVGPKDLNTNDAWFEVEVDGKQGWIYGPYTPLFSSED